MLPKISRALASSYIVSIFWVWYRINGVEQALCIKYAACLFSDPVYPATCDSLVWTLGSERLGTYGFERPIYAVVIVYTNPAPYVGTLVNRFSKRRFLWRKWLRVRVIGRVYLFVVTDCYYRRCEVGQLRTSWCVVPGRRTLLSKHARRLWGSHRMYRTVDIRSSVACSMLEAFPRQQSRAGGMDSYRVVGGSCGSQPSHACLINGYARAKVGGIHFHYKQLKRTKHEVE